MNTPNTTPSTAASSMERGALAPYAHGSRARWNSLVWAMVLVPATAVGAARVLFVGQIVGPSSALAENTPINLPELPGDAATSRTKLDEAVGASLRSTHGVGEQSVGLRWATGPAELSQFQTDHNVSPVTPVEAPQIARPDLVLTSIMLARGERIAVVQGKVRREGDSPIPGWTITQINPEAGTITLTHTTGASHEFSLSNRGQR